MNLKKNYNDVVTEAKMKLISQPNMFFIHIFIIPSIDTRAYLVDGFCKCWHSTWCVCFVGK